MMMALGCPRSFLADVCNRVAPYRRSLRISARVCAASAELIHRKDSSWRQIRLDSNPPLRSARYCSKKARYGADSAVPVEDLHIAAGLPERVVAGGHAAARHTGQMRDLVDDRGSVGRPYTRQSLQAGRAEECRPASSARDRDAEQDVPVRDGAPALSERLGTLHSQGGGAGAPRQENAADQHVSETRPHSAAVSPDGGLCTSDLGRTNELVPGVARA